MCTWKLHSKDTGKRHRNQGNAPRVVWEHRWTAACGASGGPFAVKSHAVAEAVAHTGRCTRQ